MIQYQHRQWGKTLLLVLSMGILVCLALAIQQPTGYLISLCIALGLLLCIILLFSLSIEVSDQDLRWQFGPGIIRKSVKLSEIAQVEVTRTYLIEGWGIHLTSRGWLYNISGFKAVAIQLKNNQQFLLGTDEPEQLVSVIRQQLNLA
ncbi:MAG: hypothetical protein WBA77_19655 [Microcoleaceae cyanobacterium]